MKLYGALMALSLIWGLSFVFIEVLIPVAGVWGTVFLRCMAGAAVLLPLFLYRWWKGKRPAVLPWKRLIVVGLFNAGLPWGLIALSQTSLTSNMAAVLNASTPILTGVAGFLLFSVRLHWRQWGGIMIGFAGIILLTGFRPGEITGERFIGVGTMLLAASCYGFVSHFTKRYLQGTDVVLLALAGLLVGAASGALGMFWLDPASWGNVIDLDLQSILAVIGLGCLGSGSAHLLYYYMINQAGAEFASMVTYLVPVTALIWGRVLLGEAVTPNLIYGLLTIFAGVYLSTKRKGHSQQLPSVKAG
ncbi:DMT family transporter [Halobacillus kuroshimensis]|uniref:DMT family transporter n=1 Tax=Halobacillus kuroshimensis TaxID=302481 RepID=A0ABS3E070_9BACI|nr:DMT family transporter [Halobacillus kuroshimensis]